MNPTVALVLLIVVLLVVFGGLTWLLLGNPLWGLGLLAVALIIGTLADLAMGRRRL